MKLVILGGSGHVGQALIRSWREQHDITLIGRPSGARGLDRTQYGGIDPAARKEWDGKTLGPWAQALESADVVVNLAGRSVNCRYTNANLKEMMDSRVDSTRVLGEAIAQCDNPPKLWLQASTATIYAHRYDAPNDEDTGIIGGNEPDVPAYWAKSIDIALAWERALSDAPTPTTRKIALRSAMTMSPIEGSVFGVLTSLARHGLGGRQGDGRQFVSWVHEEDFVRALDFLIEHEELEGSINICSPHPLPQDDFARELRKALGVRFAPPIPVWALEVGALFRQTATELILKSRRVVPTRLLNAGFEFKYPSWGAAAKNLVSRLPK